MGCWCSSAKPPQQQGQESPFTCAAGVAAARASALPLVGAKASPHLAELGLPLALLSNRGLVDVNSNAGSGASNGPKEPSTQAAGMPSARNSFHHSHPSAACCQPPAPTAPARPLRDAEFEDHAPPEDEEALEGDGGELICGVATLAVDLRVGTGGRCNADGSGGAPSGTHISDDSDGSDLLRSSRHLLKSVVPLLMNTAKADVHDVAAAGGEPQTPGDAGPAAAPRSRPAAPMVPRQRRGSGVDFAVAAAAAAADPPHQHAHWAADGALGSSQQHTTATRRPTFTRGLTRDSFLLNNTTGGGTTAASGYMLRTVTGRGELIHVDASWMPFQMGNPLQIKIGELLGRGGCGSVYRGLWRGQPVAVKVVQQVVAPPAGAAAAVAAVAGGGGSAGVGANASPTITPLIDFFGSSSGASPRDDNGGAGGRAAYCGAAAVAAAAAGGGGGSAAARAPCLPDAHASVNRLRHPNILRTYAYAVLSAAPQLGGVLPARHEHHVILELCDGGSLRSWLDNLYQSGGPNGACGGGAATAAASATVLAAAAGGGGMRPGAASRRAGSGGEDRDGGGAAHGGTAAAAAAGEPPVSNCGAGARSPAPDVGGGGGPDAAAAAQLAVRGALERAAARLGARRAGPSYLAGTPHAAGGGAAMAAACAGGGAVRLAGPGASGMDELQQLQLLQRLQQEQQWRPCPQHRQPAPPTCPVGGQLPGPAIPAAATAAVGLQADRAAAPPPDSSAVVLGRDRPSAAASTTARKVSSGGDCADRGATTLSSHQLNSEAISRHLPGLTPAQSEQLQLLGMAWVSDHHLGEGPRDCRTSGGSAGRLGGGGGGGDGAWMTDCVEAEGVALSAMSEPSTGTEHIGRLGVAAASASGGSIGGCSGAATRAGGGAADLLGAPQRRRQRRPSSPPASATPSFGEGGLSANWANATLLRANASVGSIAGSTMVRPESSSYIGFNAVQQHCVVLDDYLDDDDGDGGGDGEGGPSGVGAGGDMYDSGSCAYGTRVNATLFGDLRLHERLGLLEEGSGEGRQSSRSRCASGAATTSTVATTTPTNTTVANGGVDAQTLLNRSVMSSSGAGGIGGGGRGSGAGSTISTGNYWAAGPAAAAAPTATAPLSGLIRTESALETQLTQPSRLGQLAGAASSGLHSGGTTAAGPHPPSGAPQAPLGQHPPQPPQPPLGETENNPAIALLNRRAVGMVNSILRAAAAAAASGGGGGGASGGGGAGVSAAAAVAAEAMQGSQLRHLVTALGCLVEIAAGLSYLHAVGMVHGDVKSGNVLLKLDPRHPRGFVLKLADFGFSRVLEHGSHTYLSRPSGTLAYLSPEMVTSFRQSAAADQYAFGLLVWELVTTQPLFRGLQTPQLLYAKTHNADWQYLQWPAWCPPEVRSLARSCAELHPDARLKAAEARARLEAMWAHYQAILSRSPGGAAEGATGYGARAAQPPAPAAAAAFAAAAAAAVPWS